MPNKPRDYYDDPLLDLEEVEDNEVERQKKEEEEACIREELLRILNENRQ